MMRAISLLLVLCFLILPVSAVGVINPSTENQPLWCQFYYTKWICNSGKQGAGGVGPQGIPGINGTGGGDINYFNFTGSNLTTISNVTNFFNYTSIFSEMNQTANMTAGPQGIPGDQGIPGLDNMTAGPQGPQGDQGIQGVPGAANMTAGPQGIQGETGTIPDSSQFLFLNGTRAMTGNLNLGSKQIVSLITGITGDTATNKTYVDAVNTSMKNYADAQNATAITDHGALTGLTNDDHIRYFDKDGSKAVTGTNIVRSVKNSYMLLTGGNGAADGSGAFIVLHGSDSGSTGTLGFYVPNAAKTGYMAVFIATGDTDTPVIDWQARRLGNVANPTNAQDAATKNYVDTKQKCGATDTVADGGTITHIFGVTPAYVLTTGSIASEGISVTTKGSTTFTVAIKKYATGLAGTTQTVYWCVG